MIVPYIEVVPVKNSQLASPLDDNVADRSGMTDDHSDDDDFAVCLTSDGRVDGSADACLCTTAVWDSVLALRGDELHEMRAAGLTAAWPLAKGAFWIGADAKPLNALEALARESAGLDPWTSAFGMFRCPVALLACHLLTARSCDQHPPPQTASFSFTQLELRCPLTCRRAVVNGGST